MDKDTKSILLTLDYELYGNGSGDVFKHIIIPTQKILHICQNYNAKVTIFFEVVEYWKLKEEWDKGNKMGYNENPIEAMERQIQNAYQNGHDVQLHIHPQWVEAQWIDGEWHVKNEDWRLGGFKNNNPSAIFNLIKKSKETLEDIIRKVDEKYICSTLRAGGYNIQPSEEIVKTMKSLGMKADCSIVSGAIEQGSLSQYDFSAVPVDLGYWECGEELEEIGHNGIIEIPIVTFPIQRWKKYLSWEKILSIRQNKKSAINTFNAKTQGKQSKKGFPSKISFFFQKEYQTWDFCLFSNSLHKHYLKEISQQSQRNVFAIVGHPKSFITGKGLFFLLENFQDRFRCISITEFLYSL